MSEMTALRTHEGDNEAIRVFLEQARRRKV